MRHPRLTALVLCCTLSLAVFAAGLAPGERGGVRVGERIVVAGVHKLRAGEKIKAVERQPATER